MLEGRVGYELRARLSGVIEDRIGLDWNGFGMSNVRYDTLLVLFFGKTKVLYTLYSLFPFLV